MAGVAGEHGSVSQPRQGGRRGGGGERAVEVDACTDRNQNVFGFDIEDWAERERGCIKQGGIVLQ